MGPALANRQLIGSLANAHRQHLEGAPPGIANTNNGIRMVQPPMRYTSNNDEGKKSKSGDQSNTSAYVDGDSVLSSSKGSDRISRIIKAQMESIIADPDDVGNGSGDGPHLESEPDANDASTEACAPPSISRVGMSYGDVANERIFAEADVDEETKAKMKARAARRQRAQMAIADWGGKIGIDHHEASSYPLPGKTVSKYHHISGRDKARALARPYVGMNMNVMRRILP